MNVSRIDPCVEQHYIRRIARIQSWRAVSCRVVFVADPPNTQNAYRVFVFVHAVVTIAQPQVETCQPGPYAKSSQLGRGY